MIITSYPSLNFLILLLAAFLGGVILFQLLKSTLHKAFEIENEVIDAKLRRPIYLLSTMLFCRIFFAFVSFLPQWDFHLTKIIFVILIFSITLLIIRIFSVATLVMESKFDTSKLDNLKERKLVTQFNYVKKIVNTLLWTIAFSVILLSFEEVRQLGFSILASAGITGIVIGLAAQKTISNLLAGFQIAFTQPIRIDDVVIVEGEWGRIEEITLTYVVVKIWDERRMITPLTYFIEKPFQNWTRTKAELLGAVFIWVDYSFPVDDLRKELSRLVELNPLWDKRVEVLQVVETSEQCIQLRVLVSADESSKAFDLRCDIREGLITYIQKNHPNHLPKLRIEHKNLTENLGA